MTQEYHNKLKSLAVKKKKKKERKKDVAGDTKRDLIYNQTNHKTR